MLISDLIFVGRIFGSYKEPKMSLTFIDGIFGSNEEP